LHQLTGISVDHRIGRTGQATVRGALIGVKVVAAAVSENSKVSGVTLVLGNDGIQLRSLMPSGSGSSSPVPDQFGRHGDHHRGPGRLHLLRNR
jgi:hypothetical protein